MDTSPAGRQRKRSWPEALKREIVAATREPGASVSRVARRYDVNVNQVFTWCKRYGAELIVSAELRLMPVAVTPDAPGETAPWRGDDVVVTNWLSTLKEFPIRQRPASFNLNSVVEKMMPKA